MGLAIGTKAQGDAPYRKPLIVGLQGGINKSGIDDLGTTVFPENFFCK